MALNRRVWVNMLNDPTWEEMVLVEPGLARLLSDVLAIKDDPAKSSFCCESHWTKIKGRALRLVGFQARNPELRSSVAYETAVAKLYLALPGRRGCACFG
jgi:hypothetical protein